MGLVRLPFLVLILVVSLPVQAQVKRIRWSTPLCTEFSQSGTELRRIPVEEARCDRIYTDGDSVRSIHVPGLYISSVQGFLDSYYIATIFVSNEHKEERLDVLTDKAMMVLWPKPNQPPIIETAIAPEQIAAKFARKAKIKSFFAVGLASLARDTYHTSRTSSGTFDVMGSGGFASGTYTGVQSESTSTPNHQAMRNAQIASANARARAEERGDLFVGHGLSSTTLFPGDQIRGSMYFREKKFFVGIFAIELRGVLLEFGIAPKE